MSMSEQTAVEQTTVEKKEPSLWHITAKRYWLSIPQYLLDRLDGKLSGPSQSYTYIVVAVIIGLTAASIHNMDSIGGYLLAVCVPVSVYAAAHRGHTYDWLKWGVMWAIALLFAFTSASLQFRSHAGEGYSIMTMFSANADLYALATSVGIPVAECLMAWLAATISIETSKQYYEELAAKKAEADAETERLKEEAAEQKRVADAENKQKLAEQQAAEQAALLAAQQEEDERNRRAALAAEQAAAQRRKDAEFAQRLELEKLAKIAEIETKKAAELAESEAKILRANARVAKAEAVKNQGSAGVAEPESATNRPPQSATPIGHPGQQTGQRSSKKLSPFERRIVIVDMWKEGRFPSQRAMSTEMGIARSTIDSDIKWLLDRKVADKIVNDDTGEVTYKLNGKEAAFRAGELN